MVILPDKPEYYIEGFDDPEERQEIYEWCVLLVLFAQLSVFTLVFT